MKNHLTAVLAAAAFAASLTSIAAAAPTASSPLPAAARGAEESVKIGMSHVAMPTPKPMPTDASGIDRTFHPDYSRALTVDQMSAAWNAEIDRVFETPIAGGG
jgi:hypothetical protein